MLTNAHKTQRMASALTFSEEYHKDDHILYVTGDETWVSCVNIETEQQSKLWMYTHSPNKPKQLNKFCLPESYGNCFLGQDTSAMLEFMQQRITITSQAYCETLKLRMAV
jgi:hypothetical protein